MRGPIVHASKETEKPKNLEDEFQHSSWVCFTPRGFLCCWFTTLVKSSRHAGNLFVLLVYYHSEGLKARWESFCAAGLLPQ